MSNSTYQVTAEQQSSDEIPLFEISWGREEITNVVDSITRGKHWANGPYVDRFEERIEAFVDAEHAIVFNSGTTALVAALRAHGIGEGDEVIVPSFTFISTVNAVRIVGADPVFADIESETYGLDPDHVDSLVTDDTVAIIPVHYAGSPCQIDALDAIADAADLTVIEDAAEAFGATLNGTAVGTFGDSGMFSFCQNKVAATGEGGAIVTDDDDIASELSLYRSHGRMSSDYFESSTTGEYSTLGTNYRMADVVAAIGVAQLDRIEDLISCRRRVARHYEARFASVSGVEPMSDPSGGNHVYQLYTVTFDDQSTRDDAIRSLSDAGIASKVYFEPVHRTAYYQRTCDQIRANLPMTEHYSKRVLSLPMYHDLSVEEIDRIGSVIETVCER